MRVKDKLAIVAGGNSGLGKPIATRLAGEGASIVVADLNENAANATVQEPVVIWRARSAPPRPVAAGR
jgi:NAD(P)-dependent dehydrogenase (short-subunit alcohol dehydrogenase family)